MSPFALLGPELGISMHGVADPHYRGAGLQRHLKRKWKRLPLWFLSINTAQDVCTHTRMYACRGACMQAFMHAGVYACRHAGVYACMHAGLHAYMHARGVCMLYLHAIMHRCMHLSACMHMLTHANSAAFAEAASAQQSVQTPQLM